jgi:ABC-type transport system involved in multi-copper enzyme maturation permease subunit
MISLLRADLFKTRKRAMGWILLAITGLIIVVVMLNSALQDPSHVTYAFPSGLLPVGSVLPLFGVLVLIILGATTVGSEYGYDTWKNLLVRRPGRVVFILSKWLTLVIVIAFGLVILLPLVQALGLVLDAALQLRGTSAPQLGTVLLLLLTQAIAPLVAGSFAILGAVIGRSSVAGIIAGITWFIVDALLGAVLQPASLSMALHLLQTQINGTTFPSLYVAVASLTVTFYLIAPVAIAAVIFQKRDMVGVG